MAISIVQILGTDKISASRSVINTNFNTLSTVVNALQNNVSTVTATSTDLLKLFTAVGTVSPLVRFQMDANTGKLTVFDDDGVTPRIVLDKASNGAITLSSLIFSSSNLGTISMPYPGSTAALRNCTVAEALVNGSTSASAPISAAVLYNGERFADGTNTVIALSNSTATYTLSLSTSFKNLMIINSLYTTGNGTNVTLSLGSITSLQADGLEISIYNSGSNSFYINNVTFYSGATKMLSISSTGYAKLRYVNTGLSATWVIVSAFNTTGI